MSILGVNFYLFNDYFIYIIASRLMSLNQQIYGISDSFSQIKNNLNLSFHWANGYSYPPLLAFMLKPLAMIDPWVSAYIWTFINISLYLIFIKLILKKFHINNIIFIMLTFLPFYSTLLTGQINIFVLWFLYAVMNTKNILVKSVCLSAAVSIKVFPLFLLIPMFAKKEYRTIFYTVILLFCMNLPFGLLFGKYLFEVLPEMMKTPATYYHLQSLHSLFSRLNINNQVFEISIIAAAGLISLLNKQIRSSSEYWLIFGSLISAQNSFANILLILPSILYLLEKRIILIFPLLITNLLFPLSIITERMITPDSLIKIIIYAGGSSLGVIAQIGILIKLIQLKREI